MGGISDSLAATMLVVLQLVADLLLGVGAGELYSAFQCSGSEEPRCGVLYETLNEILPPTETYGPVSRVQCIGVCYRHDWVWANFIEDASSGPNTGQCQLFNQMPRTTISKSNCTLYKVQSLAVQSVNMKALCNPELSLPDGVSYNCTFPFTYNGLLYDGCESNIGCPTVNRAQFLQCATNVKAVQLSTVIVTAADQPNTSVQSIFGWIIWMKGSGYSFNWARNWDSFKNGIGLYTDTNYWLGLERLYVLTNGNNYRLRVEVQDDQTLAWYSAEYWSFKIGSEIPTKYRLNVAGFSGDAGDGLSSGASQLISNGMKFSTYDNDNDGWDPINCASDNHGGWWHQRCYYGILTVGGLSTWPVGGTRFKVRASRMMMKLRE